jgi:hypothetical protein
LVAVLRLDGPARTPSLEQIRAEIEAALRAEPGLVARASGRRLVLAPEFDIRNHVRDAGAGESVDALLARPLDPRLPLFETWMLRGRPDAGCIRLVSSVASRTRESHARRRRARGAMRLRAALFARWDSCSAAHCEAAGVQR